MTGSALTLIQVLRPEDSNRMSKVYNSTEQTETEALHEEPKSKVNASLGLSLVPLAHLHFILRSAPPRLRGEVTEHKTRATHIIKVSCEQVSISHYTQPPSFLPPQVDLGCGVLSQY